MTVCIAARCSDVAGKPSRAVVIAADRMTTLNPLGGLLALESPVIGSKLVTLTDHSVAAVVGNAPSGNGFLADMAKRFTANESPITSALLADAITKAYRDRRLAEMTQQIFGARGISLDGFYGGANRDLPAILAPEIDKAAKDFAIAFELLMGSVDADGAHIHGVGNPGMTYPYDSDGFAALGQGNIVAKLSMADLGYSPGNDLPATILDVFVSAMRAEAVQGVGLGVDMAVIQDHGVSRITASQIVALGQIVTASRATARATALEGMADLGLDLSPPG